MPTDLQIYLNFDGRCEEAVEFYKRTLGAQVDVLMRAKDAPATENCPPPAADQGDKIMHTTFRIGGIAVMASDCHSGGQPKFEGFSLTLSVPDEAECDRLVAALADGGKVEMPPAKTFWSPRFAVVSDRFGVSWMVNTCTPQSK
ncbi:MAG TPA: VOC family protein [Chthoniobacteraceae bacterium]|jgi:PhnB protein|nr:VOC family protein [Chthoniobacteraceae bacterium]